MGLRVRKDLFSSNDVSNNEANIQENSMKTVKLSIENPMKTIKLSNKKSTKTVQLNKENSAKTVKLSFESPLKTVQLSRENHKVNVIKDSIKVSPEKRKMDTENLEKRAPFDGEWFNARTFLQGMANKMPKLSSPALEADNKEPELSTPKMSSAKVSPKKPVALMTSSKDVGNLKFSNHTRDAVQTVCQVCGSRETLVNMRSHTRKVHGISITDYKNKHGALSDHFVEAVYHKCGLCSKVLLLDPDTLAPHAKSHGITHRDYSAKYMTLNYPQRKGPAQATTN